MINIESVDALNARVGGGEKVEDLGETVKERREFKDLKNWFYRKPNIRRFIDRCFCFFGKTVKVWILVYFVVSLYV